MTLRADEIEALRLVRDFAREALDVLGLGRVTVGRVREIRRAYEGLQILDGMIDGSEPVPTPEAHLLTCVRLGTERGWSVEVDADLRSVTFRRPRGSFLRLDNILLGDEPIEAEVARILDQAAARMR